MQESEDEESTKSTRSLVWNHFTREKKGKNSATAKCNHCCTTLSVMHGSTSSLIKHIKRHPAVFAQMQKSSTDNKKLTSQSKVNDFFEVSAITTDLWTSKTNESFLAVTLHFLDPEFVPHNVTLGNYPFHGDHTGLQIYKTLEDVLSEWGITGIKIYIISDNARNMKSAVSLNSSWIHFLCFAHTLQLLINDAKKESKGLENLLKRCRAIVGHYRHSSKATQRLTDRQISLGLPQHHLIQSVETRWNSEFFMLERLLEQRSSVTLDLTTEGVIDCLSANDWKMVEGMVEVLRPLEEATRCMSSIKYPTLSMVIPIILGLSSSIEEITLTAKPGFAVGFSKSLTKALKSRFSTYRSSKETQVAMLCDPRFKSIMLTDREEKITAHDQLLEMLKEVHEPTAHDGNDKSSESGGSPGSKLTSLWSKYEKLKQENTKTTNSSVELEVELFFKEETIPKEQCAYKWWAVNQRRFPKLAILAREYLAVPSTEVESERVFSTSGNILSSRRANLDAENVNILTFLHDNLKF